PLAVRAGDADGGLGLVDRPQRAGVGRVLGHPAAEEQAGRAVVPPAGVQARHAGDPTGAPRPRPAARPPAPAPPAGCPRPPPPGPRPPAATAAAPSAAPARPAPAARWRAGS